MMEVIAEMLVNPDMIETCAAESEMGCDNQRDLCMESYSK